LKSGGACRRLPPRNQKFTLLSRATLVRYNPMQEKPLEIERIDDGSGSGVVFRLHGPLLLGNFFSFQSMVRSDQSNLLIVDVADVPYIDSAGIGCLVGAHVSRENSGRKLIVAGASERLLNMLKATKVDQLFNLAPTVEDARARA
jgi:anti-anti-sigma factor